MLKIKIKKCYYITSISFTYWHWLFLQITDIVKQILTSTHRNITYVHNIFFFSKKNPRDYTLAITTGQMLKEMPTINVHRLFSNIRDVYEILINKFSYRKLKYAILNVKIYLRINFEY